MKNISPAVSVVIPMYNAEKYIGDCLDSILAQTFEDFEVIVVDDCSTDNSRKVVESYMSRFYNEDDEGYEKIKLISTGKNSGNPGVPTNLGIQSSLGKYVLCVDNDDLITKTALEELFNLAEKFQADVVHCEKFFQVPEDWKIDDKREPEIVGLPVNNFVTTPTLITQDFTQRARDLGNYRFVWPLWTKFIRRDFLVEKNLRMTNLKVADLIFTCCMVCSAKNYLCVPNIVNFHRERADSHSAKLETIPEALVKTWVDAVVVGFDYVNNFLNEQENFQKNLEAKYLVFEVVIGDFSVYLFDLYAQIPAFKLDSFIQREFAKSPNLIPFTTLIFSRMNVLSVALTRKHNLVQQLQAQIQNSQIQTQQNNFSQKVSHKKSSHKKKK